MVDITFDASGGSKMITFTFGQKAIKKGNIGYNTKGDFQYEEIEKTTNKISIKVTGDENTQGKEGFVYPTVDNKQCDSKGIRITQEVPPPPPVSCTCENYFSIRGTWVDEPISEESHTVDTEIAVFDIDNSCLKIGSITTDSPDWLYGLGIPPGVTTHGIVTGRLSANTATDERRAEISVSYSADGVPCPNPKKFYLRQSGTSPTPPECDCSKSEFTVNKTDISVSSAGTTSLDGNNLIEWSIKCGSVTAEITQGNDWLGFNSSTGDNYRYITAATNDTSSARTGVVIIRLKEDTTCTSGVTITQAAGPTCNCQSFELAQDSITLSVGESTSISYSANCTSIYNINYDSAVIDVVNDSSSSLINITGKTEGTSTITIYYNAGSSQCNKTISVTADCPTITISPDNATGNCSGGTVTFTKNE